jgi:hypothetical protein
MIRADASHWMPFYGDRFFDSERVIVMEPAAKMLYLTALWRQWNHGALPSDDATLRKLFTEYAADWDRLWPQVRPMFDLIERAAGAKDKDKDKERDRDRTGHPQSPTSGGYAPSGWTRRARAFDDRRPDPIQPRRTEYEQGPSQAVEVSVRAGVGGGLGLGALGRFRLVEG